LNLFRHKDVRLASLSQHCSYDETITPGHLNRLSMSAQRIEDHPADLQSLKVTRRGSGGFSVFLNQPVHRALRGSFMLLQETVESKKPILFVAATKLLHSFNVVPNRWSQMASVRRQHS
jgi:hypothetical protein